MTTYLIVGPHRVCGAEPGELVDIDDDAHATYLIAAGHVVPAGSGGTEPPPDEGTTQEGE